jgi:hypothetical protein
LIYRCYLWQPQGYIGLLYLGNFDIWMLLNSKVLSFIIYMVLWCYSEDRPVSRALTLYVLLWQPWNSEVRRRLSVRFFWNGDAFCLRKAVVKLIYIWQRYLASNIRCMAVLSILSMTQGVILFETGNLLGNASVLGDNLLVIKNCRIWICSGDIFKVYEFIKYWEYSMCENRECDYTRYLRRITGNCCNYILCRS